MIPVRRIELDAGLTKKLETRTAELVRAGAGAERARAAWKSARTVRQGLAAVLAEMAPGVSRCMYCGDGEGTDIDHFKPVAEDPYLTFTWINHLLACSYCNSNAKRGQYPCDEDGTALLVDPTADDPHDHIILNFATGQYAAVTRKGAMTIQVFGLLRPVLEVGRKSAFIRCKSMLYHWRNLSQSGDVAAAGEVLGALKIQPFADVFYSMIRRREDPGAAAVFGPDVIAALRDLPSWP